MLSEAFGTPNIASSQSDENPELYSPNTPNYVREEMFAQLRTGLRSANSIQTQKKHTISLHSLIKQYGSNLILGLPIYQPPFRVSSERERERERGGGGREGGREGGEEREINLLNFIFQRSRLFRIEADSHICRSYNQDNESEI